MADTIKQRIALEGGDAVKSQLEAIGAAGKKAFGDLKSAADSSGTVGKFSAGFDALKSSLGGIGEGFASVGGAVAGFATKLAEVAGVAGALSAGGFSALAVSTATAIDQQTKLAEALGLTNKELSGLQFAARQSGIDSDQFTTALTKLARGMDQTAKRGDEYAKKLGDIQIKQERAFEDKLLGNNPILKQFRDQARAIDDLNREFALGATAAERLGVAVKDASGNIRNEHDVLLDFADAFAKLPDGPRKAALALEEFGKGAIRMVPFLNKGREGILELEREAERLAPAISDEAAKKATNLSVAFDNFQKALGGLKTAAVKPFFELLTDGFKSITELVVTARGGIASFATDFATSIKDALPSLTDLRSQVVALARDITNLIPAFEGVQQFKFSDVFSEITRAIQGLRIGLEFLKNSTLATLTSNAKSAEVFAEAARKIKEADENTKSASGSIAEIGRVLNDATDIAKKFNDEVAKLGKPIQAGNGGAAGEITRSFAQAGARIIQIGQESAGQFTKSFVQGGARIIQVGQDSAGELTKSYVQAGSRVIQIGQDVAAQKITPEVNTAPAIQAITTLPATFVPTVNEIQTQFANTGLRIGGTFEQVGPQIQASLEQVAELIPPLAEQIAAPIPTALDAIDVGEFGSRILDAMQEIATQSAGIAEQFSEPFINAVDSVAQEFQQLGDEIAQTLNEVVQEAQDAGQAIDSALSDVGGGFADGGPVGNFASGGFVRGAGTGTSDSIIARVSNGEYIFPYKAVQHWGLATLERMRRLQNPFAGFSLGGLVNRMSNLGSAMPRYAEGGLVASGGGSNLTLVLDGRSIGGFTATPQAVDQLTKYSISRQLHSAGRKAGYFGR